VSDVKSKLEPAFLMIQLSAVCHLFHRHSVIRWS